MIMKFFRIILALLVSMVLFCFAQCKKEHSPLNITLYNKSLLIIQSYIQGSWKLEYGKGGICGTCIQHYQNTTWEFTQDNKVKELYNGLTLADTTINWLWNKGTYTNGDSTFIMSFYDKQNVPWNY